MSESTDKILKVIKWTNIITRYSLPHAASPSSPLESPDSSSSASQVSSAPSSSWSSPRSSWRTSIPHAGYSASCCWPRNASWTSCWRELGFCGACSGGESLTFSTILDIVAWLLRCSTTSLAGRATEYWGGCSELPCLAWESFTWCYSSVADRSIVRSWREDWVVSDISLFWILCLKFVGFLVSHPMNYFWNGMILWMLMEVSLGVKGVADIFWVNNHYKMDWFCSCLSKKDSSVIMAYKPINSAHQHQGTSHSIQVNPDITRKSILAEQLHQVSRKSYQNLRKSPQRVLDLYPLNN